MKIQIRRGCFETNSSSAHCLVIANTNEKVDSEELKWQFYNEIYYENAITIPELYFGRAPFKILTEFRSKFFYTLGALSKEYGDKAWNEIEDFVHKYISPDISLVPTKVNHDGKYFDTKEEAQNYCDLINSRLEKNNLLEDYKVEVQEHEGRRNSYYTVQNYSIVDVEDNGGLNRFLKDNNLTIEEFLISKKYIIIIDGDEYYIWKDLKKCGIINNNLEEISF